MLKCKWCAVKIPINNSKASNNFLFWMTMLYIIKLFLANHEGPLLLVDRRRLFQILLHFFVNVFFKLMSSLFCIHLPFFQWDGISRNLKLHVLYQAIKYIPFKMMPFINFTNWFNWGPVGENFDEATWPWNRDIIKAVERATKETKMGWNHDRDRKVQVKYQQEHGFLLMITRNDRLWNLD